MKDRILAEPTFALGALVWLVAATLFPWQLGLAGASVGGFVAYLVIAGALLAVADAVLNPTFYHRWDDVALQGLFWTIGLSVPSAILFAFGMHAAPATEKFQDDLCVMAGLANPADNTESALEEALEPSERCEVSR
ncbi:MAG TPA: hypothetical protein VNR60_02500 [Croceibacterium sp.]|nr:hypothetical protein [Croceibacterium sp.]